MDDFLSDTFPRDFSHLAKPKGSSSNAGMFGSDTIFSDLLGEPQSPSEKSGIEPVVSSDFKAMLEAALLSPYKFYQDEGNSSLSDTVCDYNSTTVQMHAELDHVSSTLSDTVEVATPQHPTDITETTAPITSANLSSLQNFDAQIDKISFAIISESLFDTEEESLLSSIHETCDAVAGRRREPSLLTSNTKAITWTTWPMSLRRKRRNVNGNDEIWSKGG